MSDSAAFLFPDETITMFGIAWAVSKKAPFECQSAPVAEVLFDAVDHHYTI
jgi:hypothetical protein